jgi:D-amino peptidase
MPGTVLISADMEGAVGAATPDDVAPGTDTWAGVHTCWIQDVNTVVDALFASGADEVVVTDAHGSGSNLDPSQVDPRAALIRGVPRRFGMLEGIDGGVTAVVFLGYHGTAGSGGVLSHAYMASGIHTLRVNGESAGEGTVNAQLARHFGAPVLLVSGDETACAEAGRYAPQAEQVLTKQALARFTAKLRPSLLVRQELAAAARTAMARLADGALTAPAPIAPAPTAPAQSGEPGAKPGAELCAEIEFSGENLALAVTAIPGVVRTGLRSVSYTSGDVPQWYRCLGAIWTIARSAQRGRYG